MGFSISHGKLQNYTGYGEKEVVIPDNVRVIQRGVFRKEHMTSVIIPESVGKIESGAFEACRDLLYVEIESSKIDIDDNAFWNCHNLSAIYIKDLKATVHSVSAFKKVVAFPNSLKEAIEEQDIETVELFTGDNFITPKDIQEFLHLCIDKEAYDILGLFLEYMKTNPYILMNYKEKGSEESLDYIKEHFPDFMTLVIENNDTEAVQKFTEVDGLFTPENIKTYLHQCINKDRTEILMILMDYKANLPKS